MDYPISGATTTDYCNHASPKLEIELKDPTNLLLFILPNKIRSYLGNIPLDPLRHFVFLLNIGERKKEEGEGSLSVQFQSSELHVCQQEPFYTSLGVTSLTHTWGNKNDTLFTQFSSMSCRFVSVKILVLKPQFVWNKLRI